MATVGELTYNGYTFNDHSHISVTEEPIYDEAGQIVKWVEIRITVQTIVTNNGISTDGTLENIRERLMINGKKLVFKDMGFGDNLTIEGTRVGGTSSHKTDVNFGPRVEVLSWTPVGSAQACECLWSCTVTVAECERPGTAFISFNYTVSWDHHPSGDVDRTITGFYEVANWKLADNGQFQSADAYFWRIFSPSPAGGFRRTYRKQLSQNKSRMDFTITDRQIASNNEYPSHFVEVSASHRTVRRRRTMCRSDDVLEMSGELAPGVNGTFGWVAFLSLLQKRLQAAKQNGSVPILQEISAEESIYSRNVAFHARWWFTSSIFKFLDASGLWTPVRDNSWNEWEASLADTMFNYRGQSYFSPWETDVIVNMCINNTKNGPLILHKQVNSIRDMGPRLRAIYINEKPNEEESYSDYKTSLIPYRSRPVSRQAIIQSPDSETNSDDLLTDRGIDYGEATGTSDVLQEGGRSSFGLIFAGHARRIGYKIPRPAITSIGGQTPVEVDSKFATTHVGDLYGQPEYEATWRINYMLSNSPGETGYRPSDPCESESSEGAGQLRRIGG